MQSIGIRQPAFLRQQPGPLVEKLGRMGYAAKGVIYLLIGILAAKAALDAGGRVTGAPGAVREIGAQPFGQVLLIMVGVGLMGYALWRLLAAVIDIENRGTSGKAVATRIGYAASAVMNAAIGWTALQMATGIGSPGPGGVKTWASQMMAHAWGPAVIGLIGLGLIASGAHQIKKAVTREHVRELELSRLGANERNWVIRIGQLGLIARGVVFSIIGIALVKAVLGHDPGRAKGIGEALRDVASTPFGMVLLLVVAVGLAAYGAYQVLLSRYRRMPAT